MGDIYHPGKLQGYMRLNNRWIIYGKYRNIKRIYPPSSSVFAQITMRKERHARGGSTNFQRLLQQYDNTLSLHLPNRLIYTYFILGYII